ncbi:proprotein convertase P-domain-containing protein [Flagellimonas sp. 389]|uniref:zinc-dependent metalloprotease n=1 Tax=Flagellimonas sp. 389 TaxID=2835862 RepID=UPI001BD601CE|nr:zinc-dependent metalloprotease family protein [Flagellimonas sp. 389]MBS9462736.1 proprotein convertase P-domain-containing protein [Flagellimonas sp. 389]
MKAKLHLVFAITIFFTCFYTYAQQGYWKSVTARSSFKSPSIQSIGKTEAVFTLDTQSFSQKIKSVSTFKNQSQVIDLPNHDGEVLSFALKETSVFHPDLAKKYPNIKSFSGLSLDGKYRVRLSSSPKGLQSMIVDVDNHETVFMEQLSNKSDMYVVYKKGESAAGKDGFVCNTEKSSSLVGKTISPLVADQELRRFRIAVSASGEYTDFHGGTVAGALAAINATLTRINEVFETDLGVTLELVPNNDLIIFTDAANDPYSSFLNSQAPNTVLNGEVQSTITETIGEANYDVGHLFYKVDLSSQNSGNAGDIGTVCRNGIKGSAFSATSIPQGDVFDLDFVSHELGHQFGANHTWSFQGEGTGVQSEPGSGTTIMGYAGIAGVNNVAPNGDDYFHYNSIFQISEYLQTVSCGQTVNLSNAPPILTPMGDYVIPKGTAFVLEGTATDSDVSDVLTYTWEQINNGIVTVSNFGPENPSGANFRSLPPTTDPSRYFPRLSSVVQGNLIQTNPTLNSAWETVSTVERTLSFAFTARDNASGGGQVVSDLLDVQVINSAGPFVVTSQTSNEVYEAGSIQEVTWNVANTNSSPIDAQTVDIFLSVDGGSSFPITLLEDVLNDGSTEILIPGNSTTTARIMVKASENVFFAVNSSNFSIETSNVVLDFQNLSFDGCQPNDIVIPFTYQTFSGFSETSTFSADLPAGLTASFVPAQATANNTDVQLTISNTNGVAPAAYPITITSTAASEVQNIPLSLAVGDTNFPDIVLLAPTDAEVGTSVGPRLEWEENELYKEYDIEIATDVGFANIITAETVPFNFFQSASLDPETSYFWRVRPRNDCGVGTFGTPFSFTTTTIDCKNLSSRSLPLTIAAVGTPTETTSLQFVEDLTITDVNINLELSHTFLEDLIITLISPAGTRVALISNVCGNLNNVNATFDDDGASIVCSGNPAISGTVNPSGSLSAFNGESVLGEWILEIKDLADGDGGTLTSFSMEVCAEGQFRPDEDEDGVFDDGDDLCLGTPAGVEVDATGCPINRLPADNYTVQIQSEACRSNNDGSIILSASNTSLTYSAILNGGGNTTTIDFMNEHVFENLTAGNYSLCITATDGSITYDETCFDVIVSEPELLSVSATADSGLLALALSGASLYNIELNGLVTQTENSQIQLNLKNGLNTLKVFSNLPCQGSYEQTFFFSSRPVVYPNPVDERTKVFLNDLTGEIDIQVFSDNGRLVLSDKKRVEGNELEIDFSSLSTGVYYLSIAGSGIWETIKLIKE